jgi:hypothetical protein
VITMGDSSHEAEFVYTIYIKATEERVWQD